LKNSHRLNANFIDGSYTDFKIGRGLTEAENICVSMLGGIQPDKLMRCLIQAKEGNNDGVKLV
jgi:hypothetical protein